MNSYRVTLFRKQPTNTMERIMRFLAPKPKFREGELLEIRMRDDDRWHADVYRGKKLVGAVNREMIEETFEMGGFVHASYCINKEGVDKLAITYLDEHELENNPVYEAWRARRREAQRARRKRQKEEKV